MYPKDTTNGRNVAPTTRCGTIATCDASTCTGSTHRDALLDPSGARCLIAPQRRLRRPHRRQFATKAAKRYVPSRGTIIDEVVEA